MGPMSSRGHGAGRPGRAALAAFGALAIWALLVTAACGGPQVAGDRAELRMVIEPESASVYIDDRFIASGRKLAARPVRLPVGEHLITVSAPGYFPHDVRV
ncbi:MAG: hypothetical protein DRJ42_13005, partial [Deltaproteobacteria bacterium]